MQILQLVLGGPQIAFSNPLFSEVSFRFEFPVERVFGLVQSFWLSMDEDGDDFEFKGLEVRVQPYLRSTTDGVLQFRVEPNLGGFGLSGSELILAEIKALVIGV